MSIVLAIVYLLIGILVILSVRIVTTTIHELGHALPALLFTSEPVNIFVGSYGDEAKSFPIRLGRLRAYFKWEITEWNLGVCMHQGTNNLLNSLLIILGGPLFSLLFSVFLTLWIYTGHFSTTTIFLLTFFIISGLWDFFVNIIPYDKSLPMYDGTACYNDGYQLRRLWRSVQYPTAYTEALEKMEKKEYPEAIEHLHQVLEEGFTDREIYRLLAENYQHSQDYEGLLNVMAAMTQYHKLKPEDHGIVAFAYLQKGRYAEAINYYSQALYLHFDNPQYLYNRGMAYLQSGEYQEAARDFEVALAYDPHLAAAYNHLGLAMIRLHHPEEGKPWLDRALQLSPNDPKIYLHLAFYFEQIQQYREALAHFEKAKALGSNHHGIDFYIEELKRTSK